MFKNNEFNNAEWSAPYMVDKDEIKDTISGFRLEGREIADICRRIGVKAVQEILPYRE